MRSCFIVLTVCLSVSTRQRCMQGFLGSLLQLAALALVTPLCTLGHVLAARWFAIWCVK